MKIKKMHIYGFGKWQDQVFELEDGLQLFIGKNESGKTTLYHFILQMLFGFAQKNQKDSYYRPLHSFAYGGKIWLEFDHGQENLSIERVEKQGQMNCVVQLQSGEQGGEELLDSKLAGMTLEDFKNFHAINLQQLQVQNQASLTDMNQFYLNEGVLGTDLFIERQKEWQDQADQLYRKQARIRPINIQIKQMEELEQKLQQARQRNNNYRGLLEKEGQLKEKMDQVQAQLKHEKQDIQAIEHSLKDRPLRAEIKKQQAQAEKIKDRPLPDYALEKYKENEEKIRCLEEEEKSRQQSDGMNKSNTTSSAQLTRTDIQAYEDQIKAIQRTEDQLNKLEEKVELEKVLLHEQAQQWDFPLDEYQLFLSNYGQNQEQAQVILEEAGQLVRSLNKYENQEEPTTAPLEALTHFKKQLAAMLVSALILVFSFKQSYLFLSFLLVVFILGQLIYFLLVRPAYLLKWINYQQAVDYDKLLQAEQEEMKNQLKEYEKQWNQLFFSAGMSLSQALSQQRSIDRALIAQKHLMDRNKRIAGLEQALDSAKLALQQDLNLTPSAGQDLIQLALQKIDRAKKEGSTEQFDSDLAGLRADITAIQAEQQEWLKLCQADSKSQLFLFFEEKNKKAVLLKQIQSLKSQLRSDDSTYSSYSTEELRALYQKKMEQVEGRSKQIDSMEEKYLDLQIEIRDLERRGTYDKLKQDFENERSKLKKQVKEWMTYRFKAALINRTIQLAQEGYMPHLLEEASRLFQTLTMGSYSTILYQDHSLQLIDQKGQSFQLHQLSTASQEQLYLALRLAFIRSFNEFYTLPILIDDGFVNFDQARQEQTMAVLEELADQNQIILWTKNEHLAKALKNNPSYYL